MYVVCREHLEEAIDEFVEAYGAAPDVHVLAVTPFTDWSPPEHCQYCEGKPIYLVV